MGRHGSGVYLNVWQKCMLCYWYTSNLSVTVLLQCLLKFFTLAGGKKEGSINISSGIQGMLLDWVKDFLSNRSQIVILNNASSESTEVLSGVPQGSVLGPLLFFALYK